MKTVTENEKMDIAKDSKGNQKGMNESETPMVIADSKNETDNVNQSKIGQTEPSLNNSENVTKNVNAHSANGSEMGNGDIQQSEEQPTSNQKTDNANAMDVDSDSKTVNKETNNNVETETL